MFKYLCNYVSISLSLSRSFSFYLSIHRIKENGNMVKNVKFDPGAVLDRVIASADPSDSCYLYKLADFRKSGQLVEAFNTGGR